MVVPYKHYSADAIETALKDSKQECFPGETSTANRLRVWFSLLRTYFERTIEALKLIHREDLRLRIELSSLTSLNPAGLPTGWLRHLVRMLVNSARWPPTRLA